MSRPALIEKLMQAGQWLFRPELIPVDGTSIRNDSGRITADSGNILRSNFYINPALITFGEVDVGGDLPGLDDEAPASWDGTTQSPFVDPFDNIIYLTRQNSSGQVRLSALRWSERPEERVALSHSPFGYECGHQNNALYRPSKDEEPLFFFPRNYYVSEGVTALPYSVRVTKWDYKNPKVFTVVRELTLFDAATFTTDTYLPMCISADSRFLIAEAVRNSDQARLVRVWDVAAVLAQDKDDISEMFLHEHVRPGETAAGGQGIYSDGAYIYQLSGSSVTYLSCTTIDGVMCFQRPIQKFTSEDFHGYKTTDEPEGVFWAPYNGKTEMFLAVSSAVYDKGSDSSWSRYDRFFALSIPKTEYPDGVYSVYKTLPENEDGVPDFNLAVEPGWYAYSNTDAHNPTNNAGYLRVIRHNHDTWNVVQVTYPRGVSHRIAKRYIMGDRSKFGEWALCNMTISDDYEYYQKYSAIKSQSTAACTGENFSGKPVIIVVAGQSNAVGISDSTGTGSIIVQTGRFWKASDETTGTWVQGIVDPIWPSSTGSLCPAMAEYIARFRHRPVYLINVAVSGTNTAENYQPGQSWAASGTLRSRAKNIVDAALAALGEEEYDLLGTVWLQGEYDAKYIFQGHETIEDYTETLKSTIEWFLSNIGGKFFASSIGYDLDKTACDDASVDKVNTVLTSVVPSLNNAFMITDFPKYMETLELIHSSWHYTQEGYNALGVTIGRKLTSHIADAGYPCLVTRKPLDIVSSVRMSSHESTNASDCIRLRTNGEVKFKNTYGYIGRYRNNGIAPGEAHAQHQLRFGVCEMGWVSELEFLSYVRNDGSLGDTRLIHSADNVCDFGAASNRFAQVYAGAGAIDTSDAREKQSIQSYPDAVLDAWEDVQLRQFLFLEAVAKKGEEARIHSGLIAQQVMEAFEAHGLDATKYGLLCYDKWDDHFEDVEIEDSPAVMDAEGNEVFPAITHTEKRLVTSAGDRYGIRYSEALCVEAAYQRRRAERLEKRLAALEEKIGG